MSMPQFPIVFLTRSEIERVQRGEPVRKLATLPDDRDINIDVPAFSEGEVSQILNGGMVSKQVQVDLVTTYFVEFNLDQG